MGEKTNLFPVFQVIFEYDVADSYALNKNNHRPKETRNSVADQKFFAEKIPSCPLLQDKINTARFSRSRKAMNRRWLGKIKSLRITSAQCLLSLFLFQGNFSSTSTSLGARLFRERPNSDVVSLFICTFNTPSYHIASNSENKLRGYIVQTFLERFMLGSTYC